MQLEVIKKRRRPVDYKNKRGEKRNPRTGDLFELLDALHLRNTAMMMLF